MNDKQWSQIVAKAWADEQFKKRLLANPAAVLTEQGADLPGGIEVKMVEETDKVAYVILSAKTALDSPVNQLKQAAGGGIRQISLFALKKGVSPQQQAEAWNKIALKAHADGAFKQQLSADPKAVLSANGLPVPAGLQVKLIEDTDKVATLVLVAKPQTAELTEDDLQRVVGGAKGGHAPIIGMIW